jgi:hypothetical protein
MKLGITSKITLLFFLIISCQPEADHAPPVRAPLPAVQITSVAESPFLGDLLQQAGFTKPSGKGTRYQGRGQSIAADSVIMALQQDQASYSYTFAVPEKTTTRSFTNLVFKRVIDGVKGFYVTYQTDDATPLSVGLNGFKGTAITYDLDWVETGRQRVDFSDTRSIPDASGRVADCAPEITIEKVCYNDSGTSTATGGALPCMHPVLVILVDYRHCAAVITSDVPDAEVAEAGCRPSTTAGQTVRLCRFNSMTEAPVEVLAEVQEVVLVGVMA